MVEVGGCHGRVRPTRRVGGRVHAQSSERQASRPTEQSAGLRFWSAIWAGLRHRGDCPGNLHLSVSGLASARSHLPPNWLLGTVHKAPRAAPPGQVVPSFATAPVEALSPQTVAFGRRPGRWCCGLSFDSRSRSDHRCRLDRNPTWNTQVISRYGSLQLTGMIGELIRRSQELHQREMG